MNAGCAARLLRFVPAAWIYVLDRLSKLLVEQWLDSATPLSLWPGLNLVLVYNRGAAFGFMAEQEGWQRWFLSGFSACLIAVLLVWIWRLPAAQRWLGVGLSWILGGALGNLHDRLLYGAVVDFIDLYYGRWHWPAFNVADTAICCGALLYAVLLFCPAGLVARVKAPPGRC